MWNQLVYKFRSGDIVVRLLFINLGIFALVNILGIFANLGGLDFLYSSGSGSKQLILTEYLSANSDFWLVITRPWTIITYMFTHEGLWHLAVNMLIFYYISQIFIDLLGEQRLLPLYIFGGIVGLLLYILAFNVLPNYNGARIPIIGASASVMAIMVATATYVPNYPIRLMILGTIPLKYIAGFYVLVDVLALRGNANMGGHIAHLGGAIYGFIYARQLTKGTDFGKYFYLFINGFKGIFEKKPKVRMVHKDEKGRKSSSNKNHQAKVDAILDKISKSGYENLTKEEKEFLFNASKN